MSNIIEVAGVRYRKVERNAQIGEKLVITRGNSNSGWYTGWYTGRSGEIFNVIDPAEYGFSASHGLAYVDNDPSEGSLSFVCYGDYAVLEPITEPTPSVTDLLANLALRVSELERHNREQAYEINELYKAVSAND